MRLVIFGHSAYFLSDGEVTVPENTSLTLYSHFGGILDRPVAEALANGEQIKTEDLKISKEEFFFINRGLEIPTVCDYSTLGPIPYTYKTGDRVPNFQISYCVLPEMKDPLFAVEGLFGVVEINGEQILNLQELFEEYKGHDLHWAACTLSKEPDPKAVGYGYSYTFHNDSPLFNNYAPAKKNEAEKRNKRAERFGSPNLTQPELTPVVANRHRGRQRRQYSGTHRNRIFSGSRFERCPQIQRSARLEPYSYSRR